MLSVEGELVIMIGEGGHGYKGAPEGMPTVVELWYCTLTGLGWVHRPLWRDVELSAL